MTENKKEKNIMRNLLYSAGMLVVLLFALTAIIGCGKANQKTVNPFTNTEIEEGLVEIIRTSDYEEPLYGISAPGYDHANLCYEETTQEGEVFGISTFGGVSAGSSIRVGLEYIPEVAILHTDAAKNKFDTVYILVKNQIIEEVQNFDGVQLRVELISPTGLHIGDDSLNFFPGMGHLNPKCSNSD